MTITTISELRTARELAQHLKSPSRTHPVVVVTNPVFSARSHIDIDRIAAEVIGLAEVYRLRTGEPSRVFADEMPPRTEVYGGAGRVYPVGSDWQFDPYRAPLRFADDAKAGTATTLLLIEDAMGQAFAAGLLDTPSTGSSRVACGVVTGAAATRGIVRLDSGDTASVVPELIAPGLTIERLLTAGMAVCGPVDRAGRMDVRQAFTPAQETLSERTIGQLLPVRVAHVRDDRVILQPHPNMSVEVPVSPVTTNPLDQLSAFFAVDDVVVARLTSIAPCELTLLDVDDDEPVEPAVSLIAGGPPWLQAPAQPALAPQPIANSTSTATGAGAADTDQDLGAPTGDDTYTPISTPVLARDSQEGPPPGANATGQTAAAGDASGKDADVVVPRRSVDGPNPGWLKPRQHPRPAEPGPPVEPAVAELNAELNRQRASRRAALAESGKLKRDWDLLQTERDGLLTELIGEQRRYDSLKEDLKRQRKSGQQAIKGAQQAREQLRQLQSAVGVGQFFLDQEQQFRHEVYLAWVVRIPAAQKQEYPLSDWKLGPGFLASVDSVEGVDRRKVVDVVVEVLIGRDKEINGRDAHLLRSGDAGNSAPFDRADGAQCWRVSLQANTAAARRLHYWRRGQWVELSRVVLHDDFLP